MTTSTETKNIFTALVNFHKEVDKISKDAKNPFFKSRYASLSGILDSIDNPLVNNNLAIVQFPEGDHGLTTRLCHSSGEWMEATYTMKPVKDDPQGRGSAITYQRRYAVAAILSLNVDDDDDGNAASRTNGQQARLPVKQPTTGEKVELYNLLTSSTLEPGTDGYKKAWDSIEACHDYDSFQKIKFRLEDLQKEPVNPNQKDINKTLLKKGVQTA
jgi:hypothetical protein